MIPAYKKKTNLGIGVFLAAVAIVMVSGEPLPPPPLLYVLELVALIAYIGLFYGCVMYAKGKGYSGWLGSLGIFFILGFIVLAVLPDREKQAGKKSFANP